MLIKTDDLNGPEIHALLEEHLRAMHVHSPPESVHALDLGALQQALHASTLTFWTAWQDDELCGCGALRVLDQESAEIKSMRTATAHLRRGVARTLLAHIVDEATRRGYRRLYLETGSMDAFEPARRLYAGFGFTQCGPFADYVLDPNSVFMTKGL
jgi:putative acetyltransferase